MAEAMN